MLEAQNVAFTVVCQKTSVSWCSDLIHTKLNNAQTDQTDTYNLDTIVSFLLPSLSKRASKKANKKIRNYVYIVLHLEREKRPIRIPFIEKKNSFCVVFAKLWIEVN